MDGAFRHGSRRSCRYPSRVVISAALNRQRGESPLLRVESLGRAACCEVHDGHCSVVPAQPLKYLVHLDAIATATTYVCLSRFGSSLQRPVPEEKRAFLVLTSTSTKSRTHAARRTLKISLPDKRGRMIGQGGFRRTEVGWFEEP